MNKTTGDLMDILRNNNDYSDSRQEIECEQLHQPLSILLNETVARRKAALPEILFRSGLKKAYFYNLFNGNKSNPSRDVCIQLCFGFGFTLEETQEFLKHIGAGVLYPRVPRDSVLIYCFQRGKSLLDCNILLEENGEQLLGDTALQSE